MHGKFIVLEGIDGSGKGTIASLLSDWMFRRDKSIGVLVTREPTQFSEPGKRVRELLKNTKDPKLRAPEFTRLYVEDRKWHIENRIIPALKAGCVVISDRYKYSTLAYQQLQGMPFEDLNNLHAGLLVPDMTIILDIPAEIAFERIGKDKRAHSEVFEKMSFLKELRTKYLELPQKLPGENIVIINANRRVDEVFKDVQARVETILV